MTHMIAGFIPTLSEGNKDLLDNGNVSLDESFVTGMCVCYTVHRKDNGSNEVRADGLTVTGHTWLNRYWVCFSSSACVSVYVCVFVWVCVSVCVRERERSWIWTHFVYRSCQPVTYTMFTRNSRPVFFLCYRSRWKMTCVPTLKLVKNHELVFTQQSSTKLSKVMAFQVMDCYLDFFFLSNPQN